MTSPTTSFVVTCHNLGAYLDETLDSLFAQTAQDFEVVVVNDGSTDGATCQLLATLERPRTRIVHSARLGLPGARNLGVSHAVGRYLCMVDADDLLEPTYLERSLHVLDSDPHLAFASHWLRAFGDETWDWTPTDCTFPALLHANTLNGAALMRREMFERLGGFDETMVDGCEDWEFWIRAVDSGFVGVIIPEFLFRYRRRHDSMSRTMHDVPGMPILYRQIVERHAALFSKHLVDLLQQRDEGIGFLTRNSWMLASEWTADLEGEQQWSADNDRESAIRASRDRAAALARVREQQLVAIEERLRDATSLFGETQAEVRRLHAAWNREMELNQSLRTSWSWRLSAPLRALAGWVRR